MSKIIKYLKAYSGSILVILLLLMIQAYCDLSLPEYTSKIVNVGIQQGGIEYAAPKKLRKESMDYILLFAGTEGQEKILSSYQYDEGTQMYVLTTLTKDAREALDAAISTPMAVILFLNTDSEAVNALIEKMKETLPDTMKDIPILETLTILPEEQSFSIRNTIMEAVSQMPDSIISQSAIAYAKEEFMATGGDVNKQQMDYIFVSGFKMLGMALVSMCATIFVTLLSSRVGTHFSRTLRREIFHKIVGFSNNELEQFSTASLITRTTNDIQQVQMVLVMVLRMILYAPILGAGGFIKVFQTTNSMAWVIGVAVAAALSVVCILVTAAMSKIKAIQQLIDRLNLVAREMLTGLPVIRSFSTQKHEEKRFDGANRDLMKTQVFVNRTMSCMMPAMMLIMNVTTVLIIWVGADRVQTGTMQVGDLMAFIQYTMQIIMAFLLMSMMSVLLPRAMVSAKRIGEVLDTETKIHDPRTPKVSTQGTKGFLEFRNVSFRYPDALEDVLKNLTFIAKPGETTAIIGSTGSGKSTLVNLIPRFFDVTEGEVLLDGVNIKKITQHELREKIGFVPQKGVLFSGTIESNIKFGNQKASEEDMIRAAKIAMASEFIEDKPEKYQAEISQGGTNVSGGQKQRLAIARAIAKNPDIYIFDDSFSALDYKTETALRKALHNELSETTKIVVAGRISTVLHANQIIVLDEGDVVGKGTHKELMKNCEVYQQIAFSQLSKEELGHE